MRSTSATKEEDHLKSGLSGKKNYSRPLILLKGDAKANFNQAVIDIGVSTVDNFNKIPGEMTKHAFPRYDYCG